MDLEVAIPLGLILNELISNCLKHAFPNHRSGQILVTLERNLDGVLKLSVDDNGVGLPESFDWEKCPSLGMKLIKILTEQMHAELTLRRRPGTAVTIAVGDLKGHERELSA